PDMMRLFLCSLPLGLLGCSSGSFHQDQARANLLADAEKMRTAILQEDHAQAAGLTHPDVGKSLGGTERFLRRLEEFADEMKRNGFAWQDLVFAEPSEVIEASGDLYAVVPYTLEMAGPGGATGTKPSYLIGVSKDRGKAWTFIDGEGIAGDREKLRQVLP